MANMQIITGRKRKSKFLKMYLFFQSITMDFERQPLLKNKTRSYSVQSIDDVGNDKSKFISILLKFLNLPPL